MNVVYSSPFVPPEWIAAHGARPERIRPESGAATRSMAPVAGMCPYARAMIGEVLASHDGEVAVFTTTCDQMRRAAGWVALEAPAPVFLFNVPATHATPAARLYLDELHRLGRFLARLGGSEPSRDKLAAVSESYDDRRRQLRDALGILAPREASEVIAECDRNERPRLQGACCSLPHGIPVAVIGGPLMRGDARVFDWIEEAGGAVVLDGTESGARTLPTPFDRRRLRDDPVLEIVDAYFGRIPDAFRRPDDALVAWLRRELAASGARALIIWRYVWCDLWAAFAARA
ncbi:MAG: 2-hydroxyacyl-CoA dehydratase family protein, partial [Phycisphaerae bacterium]